MGWIGLSSLGKGVWGFSQEFNLLGLCPLRLCYAVFGLSAGELAIFSEDMVK